MESKAMIPKRETQNEMLASIVSREYLKANIRDPERDVERSTLGFDTMARYLKFRHLRRQLCLKLSLLTAFQWPKSIPIDQTSEPLNITVAIAYSLVLYRSGIPFLAKP
jgi:hypothetical protein